MINLNNLEEIKKFDPKNVYGSVELVLEQCSQIWGESKSLIFPSDYPTVRNVVFSGMGGSALGAQVVYHLFKNQLKVPLYINNDYHLPGFANKETLVVLSSYSGTTEETLTSTKDAIEKGCKLTGLTTGGELSTILESQNIPYLKINPINNPAGQPRLGGGYTIFGLISILSKLKIIEVEDNAIDELNTAKNLKDETKKRAQELAKNFLNTVPVIFSSEFLTGNAHVIRNQMNETAKTFSAYSPLPELNHHLMEGLKNPKDKNLAILFLDSNLYSEIIQKRIMLTKDVVSKNAVPYFEYEALGDSKLSQSLNVLSFGGYLTLYLALLYGLDPSLIPWVDFFKENLHKV